jgi:Sensors of blue-light using FAD
MIQLVYTSSSVKPFSNEELLDLLTKSRQNNETLRITGMLLYKDGDFMQALEGEQDEVYSLSARIAKDPRHTNFVTLLDGPCSQREFPDWSMGFTNLTDLNPRDVPGYSTFLDSPLRAHVFAENPALCRKLLLLFKTKPQLV